MLVFYLLSSVTQFTCNNALTCLFQCLNFHSVFFKEKLLLIFYTVLYKLYLAWGKYKYKVFYVCLWNHLKSLKFCTFALTWVSGLWLVSCLSPDLWLAGKGADHGQPKITDPQLLPRSRTEPRLGPGSNRSQSPSTRLPGHSLSLNWK